MAGRESHGAGGWLGVVLLVVGPLAGCALNGGAGDEKVFFPPPPEPPRLQFLVSFSSSKDVEAGASAFRKFVLGEEPQETRIMGPYGMEWHDGKIYVCDVAQGMVLRLDLVARTFRPIGLGGSAMLQKPINIAIDERGHKYVADVQRSRVVVFGPDDAYRGTYGEPGQFRPTDVAVRGQELYVCDISQNEVEVLDRDTGKVLRSIHPAPEDPGFLRKPTNIALDSQGNLYVVDTVACRVIILDAAGKFVRQIGEPGDVVGQFARPKGIAIDDDGNTYVIDSAFENCQIFTPEGEIALFFGGPGAFPGAMYLPTKVVISKKGMDHFREYVAPDFELRHLVFVVNQYGGRKVNVYGFGRSTKHTYPD